MQIRHEKVTEILLAVWSALEEFESETDPSRHAVDLLGPNEDFIEALREFTQRLTGKTRVRVYEVSTLDRVLQVGRGFVSWLIRKDAETFAIYVARDLLNALNLDETRTQLIRARIVLHELAHQRFHEKDAFPDALTVNASRGIGVELSAHHEMEAWIFSGFVTAFVIGQASYLSREDQTSDGVDTAWKRV
jgi:hypothetical protein